VTAWTRGSFDLIVSELLLRELAESLAYPKLVSRITPAQAPGFVNLLRSSARVATDPSKRCEIRCDDPDDQYLVDLASDNAAWIVSSDQHLLRRAHVMPVATPARFLAQLAL